MTVSTRARSHMVHDRRARANANAATAIAEAMPMKGYPSRAKFKFKLRCRAGPASGGGKSPDNDRSSPQQPRAGAAEADSHHSIAPCAALHRDNRAAAACRSLAVDGQAGIDLRARNGSYPESALRPLI